MQNTEKVSLLRKAMEMLDEVDALQQTALGACDACEKNHYRIYDIIEDFSYNIMQLEETE